MHLIEQFWNHLRNADGDDIMFSLFTGLIVVLFTFLGISIFCLLVAWLGVLVVAVPFVIIAVLLIFYGIGHFLVERFDL